MDILRKRLVMLVVPVALILFTSFLVAQGPPNPCANACWQTYTSAVRACHGDPACLAAARAAALACVKGCDLRPQVQQQKPASALAPFK
jgi:hypothetical protein